MLHNTTRSKHSQSFPISYLGINPNNYKVSPELLQEYVRTWLCHNLFNIDTISSQLQEIERGTYSQAKIEHIINVLKQEKSTEYDDEVYMRSNILKWDRHFSILQKGWDFLFKKYPYLKENLPGTRVFFPDELYRELTKTIKGQDNALKKLSTYLYQFEMYWEDLEESRDAIIKPSNSKLIIGESGSGKTFTIRNIAKILELDYVQIDCSRLTSEGYTGCKLYTELIMQAEKYMAFPEMPDHEADKNRKVLVFLDEFDKLCGMDDLNVKSSVLNELLVLLDGKTSSISGRVNYGLHAPIRDINISRFCFVLGGAFTGIRASEKQSCLGFTSHKNKNTNAEIRNTDLLKYGVPKEVLGRIGSVIKFDALTKENLAEILVNSSESPLNYYRNFFKRHGVVLNLTNKEIETIVQQAIDQKTGARGLDPILEQFFEIKINNLINL